MMYKDVAQEPTPWEVAIRGTSKCLTAHLQAVVYCDELVKKQSFGP